MLSPWGFDIASAKGFEEFESRASPTDGLSAPEVADVLSAPDASWLFFESPGLVLTDSKFSFCENDVSMALGGDCDRCDGESGAVSESSSTFDMIPCAWLWWYFSPLACLYFLLQSCSGHSRSTGDVAQGDETFLGFLTPLADDAEFSDMALFPPGALPPDVVTLLPLKGDGLSSLDRRRFSGRGAENVVGDVDGVFVTVLGAFADMFKLVTDELRDARPFGPPFRSLLWTELRVSVKLIKSLVDVMLFLPLLPRPPLGNRESSSSVGESQNLGGAQSCFVQSISVPT